MQEFQTRKEYDILICITQSCLEKTEPLTHTHTQAHTLIMTSLKSGRLETLVEVHVAVLSLKAAWNQNSFSSWGSHYGG